MSTPTPITEQLIQGFTEQYMEKIFYFCLKKTGKSEEAEDLTQEIALCVISALNKGTVPESFSAWVWKIARNRYAMWADRKHRITQSLTLDDGGDYEIPDDSETPLDEMIHSEQLALLRRELAFIRRDYRDILVAYYIEDRSVRDIAAFLNLSVNAVQQRLHRARIILKEGMNMAREFGTKSYKPEEINYSFNIAREGKKNQPYSLMEHSLYQNIFLEAYGNPSTAEALSLELGIALPYMEEELEFLTRETLLRKNGNKYETTFPIISRSAQEQVHIAQQTAAPALAKDLSAFVDRLNKAFKETGYAYYGPWQDYESAKWTLLMLAYDHFTGGKGNTHPCTERPEGGKWDVIAYQTPHIFEPNFVGNHGSCCGFQQFKFRFEGIEKRTPHYLTEEESKLLHDFAWGEEADTTSDTAKALMEYGYLRKDSDRYVPDVLVLKYKEIKEKANALDSAALAELNEIAENLGKQTIALYEKISEIIKQDLPKILAEDEALSETAAHMLYHSRGYVFTEAIHSGWLLPADRVSYAVGAHFR